MSGDSNIISTEPGPNTKKRAPRRKITLRTRAEVRARKEMGKHMVKVRVAKRELEAHGKVLPPGETKLPNVNPLNPFMRLKPERREMVKKFIETGDYRIAYKAGGGEATRLDVIKRTFNGQAMRAAIAYMTRKTVSRIINKLEITEEKILSDLERQKEGAEGCMQYSAAVKATELQGKHIGMFQEDSGRRSVRPLIVVNVMNAAGEPQRVEIGGGTGPEAPLIEGQLAEGSEDGLQES